MSEPSGDSPLPPQPESAAITVRPIAPPAPRGHVAGIWIAWIVIVGVAGWTVYAQNFATRTERAERSHEGTNLVVLELQMRIQIGVASSLAAGKPEERLKIANAILQFERGSVEQRMMVAICLGELVGPKEALTRLKDLDAEIKRRDVALRPADRRHLDQLTTLYQDYVDGRPNAPLLAPADQADIVESFGWFGELALNQYRDSALEAAKNTMTVAFTAALVVIVAFLVGLFVLGTILILWYRGRWRRHLAPAVPHHGVYVETFALWIVLYLAMLAYGVPMLQGLVPPMFAACIAMGSSLIVLVWPVLRGVRWKQVRKDVGWTLGPIPLLEPTFGFVSYLASLPLLAIGFVWVVVYTKLTATFRDPVAPPTNPFEPDHSMAHPVIQQLSSGSMADWIPLFVLACVLAPIVEETVFRGLLYRHVRDSIRTWTFGFAFSAVIVSVVFAVVHPQSVIAAPVLASLACGFALAREWRDTLIPGVIAHSVNNTLVLAFVVLCLSK